jgi:hypothetical protein
MSESEFTKLTEAIRVKDQMIATLLRESGVEFQRDVAKLNERINPNSTPETILRHIKREVEELEEAYGQEEAADVYILLCALAWRCGYSLHHIALLKMERNHQRKWGKPDKDGVVEHVR